MIIFVLSAAAFDSFQATADGVNTHAPIERRKQTHKLKTKRLNNTAHTASLAATRL